MTSTLTPRQAQFRLALPVIERLARDLQGIWVGVLLVDDQGVIVERVEGRAEATRELDALGYVPGRPWTTPEPRWAYAYAAIRDPRSGRSLGAVGIVCRGMEANAFMQPYARQAGREIAVRLVDEARATERALLEQFVHVRRTSRGPVIAINEHRMLANAAAARFIGDDDHPTLWQWAHPALDTDCSRVGPIELASGKTVAASCEPVYAGGEIVGGLIRLEHHRRPALDEPDEAATAGPAGWDTLSPAEHGIAKLVAAGLTNQEAGARLFLSRHTIDFHLRQIFNKLGVRSRVELTRIVVETGGGLQVA